MGGGEAGPEAIAPIDVLQDYVSDAVFRFASMIPQIDYGMLGDAVAVSLRKYPGNYTVNISRRELLRIINGE